MAATVEPLVGIIGGSGLYQIEGLQEQRRQRFETPWGEPSDSLLFGRLEGVRCVFLARHGRGHRLSPSHLNYRANIDALKRAGATEILALSAVGSLKEELAPGCFVLVDQFIDRSFARQNSFFGAGVVAHVSMADPVCPRLHDALAAAASEIQLPLTRGGTYLVIEGPQFSTRAESALYRSWGASVIGMTNMPEARLAREAELCYASVAMVTDYDCWRPGHADVTIEAVIGTLNENTARAEALLRAALPRLAQPRPPCPAGCQHALERAIITDPARRDASLTGKLDAVMGRILRPE